MAIREELEKIDGIIWEQSGDWYWISGDTLPHKDELKALGCRWSKKRQKWYWKPSIKDTPTGEIKVPESNYYCETKDGYMGAYAWDGSNSKKGLYGAELTKAIRAEFKKCNIKGVSVSKKTYSGGQSVYITITPTTADILSYDEYYKNKMESRCCGNLIYQFHDPKTDKWIESRDIEYMQEEERDRLYELAVKATYEYHTSGCDLNEHFFYGDNDHDVFYGRSYADIFTTRFLDKLRLVKEIVDSFNYDNSNSMVDYFDRGFYEHYKLKAVA